MKTKTISIWMLVPFEASDDDFENYAEWCRIISGRDGLQILPTVVKVSDGRFRVVDGRTLILAALSRGIYEIYVYVVGGYE